MAKMIRSTYSIIWTSKYIIIVVEVSCQVDCQRHVSQCVERIFLDESWGKAFGEDGGRIVAAKIQINRSARMTLKLPMIII
jgi:hypothetical protein